MNGLSLITVIESEKDREKEALSALLAEFCQRCGEDTSDCECT